MTAKDLDRLEKLANEVKTLKDRLTALRNASAVSATNYSQNGRKRNTNDCVSDIEKKIRDKEFEMRMIINMMPSQKTREIYDRKYIEGQTADEIAEAMGYSEKRGVTRRMERFEKSVRNGKYDPLKRSKNNVK